MLGGGTGMINAVRTKPQTALAESNTTRLKLNRVLNLSGKTGRSAGNALGVLGLFFSSTESFTGYMADGRLPDSACTVLAGALTIA